jgi:predicted 3-demethylubiquinone-9 3-methyltransferase (glyoxalase superfamily)
MEIKNAITPCLWYDTQAEEAANFYVSVFSNSKINNVSRYGKEGYEVHKMKEGSVLAVHFQINGQPFVALNAGPVFKFNEAVSFQIMCDTQEQIDYFWYALTKDGEESQCGWLKDKYGLSWQVVPAVLEEMMMDKERSGRVMNAFMKMKKFDIEALKNA